MSAERYEIRGKIGQGGVGAVYRAYDTQLRREVAIKRVLADGEGLESEDAATKSLLKEATALSSVQHPHICTVYDAGIDTEGPYVVMELINGKTLDEMVERGTLTFEDFREVAIQSQEAMIAAQDLDLIHRDLKPSNVMVCWLPSGRFQVKLVDFGLAKFSAKPSLQTIDHGDAVFGSIFFMAPEQFERTPLDRRTDMYSLGAMYYYSLAGTYPFNGDSAPQVMASHLQGSVQPLSEVRPDLPTWVCDWVMWHIARSVDARPGSAREALESFLAHESAASQGFATAPTALTQITPVSAPQQTLPQTGVQLATPAAPQGAGISGNTAPQPIIPPGGPSSLTSSQRLVAAPSAAAAAQATQAAQAAAQAGAVVKTSPTLTATQAVQPAVGPPALQATSAIAQGGPPPLEEEEEESSEKPAREPMSTAKKMTLAAVIGVAIVILGIILVTTKGKADEAEAYSELLEKGQADNMSSISLSEYELELLLGKVVEAGKKSIEEQVVLNVILSKAQAKDSSYNADEMIAMAAVNAPNHVQENLFRYVLRNRRTEKTGAIVLDFIKNSNNTAPNLEAALGVLKYCATEEQFSDVLSFAKFTQDNSYRTEVSKVLSAIIKKASQVAKMNSKLAAEFENSDDSEYRSMCLGLLGEASDGTYIELLVGQLNNSDPVIRRGAIEGLEKWSNDAPLDILIEAAEREEDKTVHEKIFFAAHNILRGTHKHDTPEKHWNALANAAKTYGAKKKVIDSLVVGKHPYGEAIFQEYIASDTDDAIVKHAKRASVALKKRLADSK